MTFYITLYHILATKNKTQPTSVSFEKFVSQLTPLKRINQAQALNEIFKKATGERPTMWGKNIVGYGTYHYRYASGREGDFLRTGFSPGKAKISIYIMGDHKYYANHFEKLGKYTSGKSCVYINKLEDIHIDILEKLIKDSYLYIGNKTWD